MMGVSELDKPSSLTTVSLLGSLKAWQKVKSYNDVDL
jgi:hypothetical protein